MRLVVVLQVLTLLGIAVVAVSATVACWDGVSGALLEWQPRAAPREWTEDEL